MDESEKKIVDMEKFQENPKNKIKSIKKKIDNMVPFQQYFQWMHDSYTSNIPNIGKKTNYFQGMLKRLFNISTIKYLVLPNMLHSNVVMFSLYDTAQRLDINYAALFCEHANEYPKNMETKLYAEQFIGNIIMRNYSVSGSFISSDGEYRARFSRYGDFITARKHHPGIWNELELYVTRIANIREWRLSTHYFHGKDLDNNIELERIIRTNFIANTFLTLAWFHFVYAEYLGINETHLNDAYKKVFTMHIKIDKAFIVELIKKYGEANVELFKISTSNIVHPILGSSVMRYVPLGYKMVPLKIVEIQNPFDIQYKSWREYTILTKCNDLVINQITPGLQITSDWFLINNSRKGLFDNKSQFDKLVQSELAKSELNLLLEAQRSNYIVSDMNGESNKIQKLINNKFKKLNDKIQEPIDYLIEEIIISDVTLAFPSEYVGKTISDTISLCKKSKIYEKKIGGFLSNPSIFSKYIFEILYTLLSVNKHIGIIHGDLHLNNATIGYLYSMEEKNASVIYMIDDKKYEFQNNGYFGCVIDFSRAYIDLDKVDNIRDKSLPENLNQIRNYDVFSNTEIDDLLKWYLQLVPTKSKSKDELIILFKNNYSAVFKLLTAGDVVMFISRLLNSINQQKIPFHKKNIQLIEQIYRLAEEFITSGMNQLLDGHFIEEFPIKTIINKCFSEYLSVPDSKIVTDCYILNNEIKHSLSKYDLFPDAIKYSKYYDENGKVSNIGEINKIKSETRYSYEKRKQQNFDYVKYLSAKYMERYT